MGAFFTLRRIFLICLLAVASSVRIATAQQSEIADTPDGLWFDLSGTDLFSLPAKNVAAETVVQPTEYRSLWLDEPLLDDVLRVAPLEVLGEPDQAAKSGQSIWLPMPDGSNVEFGFVESPIMEPELADKFPEIKTYVGRSLDGRNLYLRFDRTPAGFHGIVLGAETVYIDPYQQDGVYVSYAAEKYAAEDNAGCAVADAPIEEKSDEKIVSINGDMLRTYRLAVACTGEYANFHGAISNETQGNAAAAIVTTVNRVTGIYESELAIRFLLVGTEDSIIFIDPATDPFPTNPTIEQLEAQSQTTINGTIGAANYDVGHTFAVGDVGGIGDFGCICDDARKASGATARMSPIGDPYDVDYVAHELGHQFRASHTFNSTKGGCKGNRDASTAYERGAGVSIMSYAGICGADNMTLGVFANFHSESLQEIQAFVLSKTSCQVATATGNTGPSVVAGPDYTIPKQTAFTLTASDGSDSEADPLLYSWEERDLGKAQAITAPDNGKSPLFRGFAPTSDAFRTFPQLEDILVGHQYSDPHELLPSKARTMTFWVVARDGKGGIGSDEMGVTVDAASGPFKVLYPNTVVTIKGGKKKNVTWDVAKTNQSPVSASHVKILLSTDGGQTFPTVLKDSTPNDGAEKIKFPKLPTNKGRVKIQGSNNIFFDMSDTDFKIKSKEFNLVGVWNSSESNQVAETIFTFYDDHTYVRCFPPPSTNCFANGEPRPWSFVEDDGDPQLPWLLTYDTSWLRCRIIDDNTIEAYLVFSGPSYIYYTTFTRQP
ncbi:MAG: hypothetical protein IT366_04305 [Candidatus Hydrogenedentes bacterium]|nr:hypothetical protein [Candidatus Hydrogenedentota bacterium]